MAMDLGSGSQQPTLERPGQRGWRPVFAARGGLGLSHPTDHGRLLALDTVLAFRVEQPDLEQVFLHLTGRHLRD